VDQEAEMTIHRNNCIHAASIGGCVWWIIICLALFHDTVTQAGPKDGVLGMVLYFAAFIGAAFYTMIWITSLRQSSLPAPSRRWTWGDVLIGFSPVPVILVLVAMMV
jgi:hypothetical protein